MNIVRSFEPKVPPSQSPELMERSDQIKLGTLSIKLMRRLSLSA